MLMSRWELILILSILLLTCVSVDGNDVKPEAQPQGDWSAGIGVKLRCMSTYSYDKYIGYIDEYTAYESSKVTANGWPQLTIENHPLVDVLETWSDIPHPNVTFWSGDENVSSPLDAAHSYYDSEYDYGWIGQGQHWFDYILPNRSPAFYEGLLSTLNEGPWNHSINPVYFHENPSYWGYRYSFSHEGFSYNVTVTYWVQAGYDFSESYAGLLREGSVKVFNETIDKEVHMRRLRCSPSGPAIGGQYFYHVGERVGPSDAAEYTEGEINNLINWDPLFLPAGFSGSFSIRKNGSVVSPEQNHAVPIYWTTLNTNSLNYSVDGLEPGVYNFTLYVSDLARNTVASTFMLTVLSSHILEKGMIVGAIGGLIIIGVGLYIFKMRDKGTIQQ